VKRKRHSAPEITAKLHQADEMAAEGKLQSAIARALGVSVMTYHRWRAGRPASEKVSSADRREPKLANQQGERDQAAQLEKLRLENLRLRRLVTDLLLEKVKLEEML
jgi:putative transposase